MNGETTLQSALLRLTQALDQLEGATLRQGDNERARADIDAELAAAQDDRQRLATELDAALARLARFDSTTTEIGRRVEQAYRHLREAESLLAARES